MEDLDKDDHIKKGFELEFIACDLAIMHVVESINELILSSQKDFKKFEDY